MVFRQGDWMEHKIVFMANFMFAAIHEGCHIIDPNDMRRMEYFIL